MFYTIYRITNAINHKIYIGKHQTKDLNDGYMGSGKHLLRAQSKHGIENFKKEILFQFDNEDEMNAKEAELVTEEFCLREDTYNLCPGGKGGFGYINREIWTIDKIKSRSSAVSSKMTGVNNPFYGQSHTKEALDKIKIRSKTREKLVCENCGEAHSPSNYTQFHGMNCSSIGTNAKAQLLANNFKNGTKIKCQHCGNSFSLGMHKRWHGDKCKFNI